MTNEPNRMAEDAYKTASKEELLEEYGRTKDPKLRQELVVRYLYVVRIIASQMKEIYSGVFQMEDIIQDGCLELMKLLDKYDPRKNVKFESYLSIRIRGMVIDRLRKEEWGSRSVRRDMKAVEKAKEQIMAQGGGRPDHRSVAEHMGISVDEYAAILQKNEMHRLLSVGDLSVLSEELQVHTDPDTLPEECCLKNERLRILADAIENLSDKERLVISLYYVEELKMAEIAEMMEVSRPRVSRLHSDALKKLKLYMDKNLQM